MKYLILVLLFLFPGKAIAETTAPKYTLPQLIEQMERNNLLLKISKYDHQIKEGEYRMSRSLPNPEFEFSRGRGERGETGEHVKLWDLGLTLKIPNPIYRHYLLKSQWGGVEAVKIQCNIQKRELMKKLKSHFYTLQLFNKQHWLITAHLANLQRAGEIARVKAELGEAKEIDAFRAAVEIQKQQTEQFRIEKGLAAERTKLNEMLDFSLPNSFQIRQDFNYQTLPPIETQLGAMVDRSPIAQIKSTRLRSEEHLVRAQQFSWIESITLFGVHGQEMDGKIWKVGVGIEVPIFSTRGRFVKQAKLQRDRARIELRHARQHLMTDLKRLVAEIRIIEKEISTFKGAVLKESKMNLELTEKLYANGEIPLIVYLDSQNSYFDIQIRYFRAITAGNLLKSQLEALIGGTL